MTQVCRSRWRYALAVAGVIGLGLASRKFHGIFPAALGKYPGDALWTLMVFFGWAFVFPKSSIFKITLLALLTSFAVEFAKLHHAPWLETIRNTTPGHLVLGYSFSWGNLLAYSVGAMVGAGLEYVVYSRRNGLNRSPSSSSV